MFYQQTKMCNHHQNIPLHLPPSYIFDSLKDKFKQQVRPACVQRVGDALLQKWKKIPQYTTIYEDESSEDESSEDDDDEDESSEDMQCIALYLIFVFLVGFPGTVWT